MKYLALLVVFATVSFAGQKTIITSGNSSVAKVTNTYANSQVDTVIFTRQAGMSAFSFAIHAKDSVSITNVILRRVFNGVAQAVAAGDTIVSSAFTTTAAGVKLASITAAPLGEQYWAIVTYAGSANGVTTPNVVYGLTASYSK